MEENGKLPHSWAATLVTWFAAVFAWVINHPSIILFILSAIATIYSTLASRATLKLRKKQSEQLTSGHRQEPDTDI